MMDACRTLVLGEDDDAAQLLATIGVTRDILKEAARVGEFARDNCHEDHPPSFPGSASWADTLRALASGTKPQRWVREERNGLSVIVSPSGAYAIAVQLGDKATGNPHMMPATKYPKGVGTLDIVRTNKELLILPGMEEHFRNPNRDLKARPLPAEGCQTWFFMRRRSYVKCASTSDPTRQVRVYADHIFLELSLPIISEIVPDNDVDDDEDNEGNEEPRARAKVKAWSTRIILGKTPLAKEPLPQAPTGPTPPPASDAGDGRFPIQITRK